MICLAEFTFSINIYRSPDEHKLFRVAVVTAQERGGGVEPVAILGDKPLRATFGVFRNLLPNFHFSLGHDRPSIKRECRFNVKGSLPV